MVTALLFFFAAVWVLSLGFLLLAARRAPVGYEDENGFHVIEAADASPVLASAASVQAG